MKNTSAVFTKVDTVIVRVRDLEKARAWYEEKLGFRAAYVDGNERLIVFDLGGETSFTIMELRPGEEMVPTARKAAFPSSMPETSPPRIIFSPAAAYRSVP